MMKIIYVVHAWLMGDYYSHQIVIDEDLSIAQKKAKEFKKKGYAVHIGELMSLNPMPHNPNIQVR